LAPTFFLRNATPRSLSSLSLHGALPICNVVGFGTLPARYMALTCYWSQSGSTVEADIMFNKADYRWATRVKSGCRMTWDVQAVRSEEHTSELQSRVDLVCRLLLEKKKNT